MANSHVKRSTRGIVTYQNQMRLHSDQETVAGYTGDAWMRADNVPPSMFPGRVERRKKRKQIADHPHRQ
jgi:hypothetical protein